MEYYMCCKCYLLGCVCPCCYCHPPLPGAPDGSDKDSYGSDKGYGSDGKDYYSGGS